jgi:hypothetical protein
MIDPPATLCKSPVTGMQQNPAALAGIPNKALKSNALALSR